MGPKGVPVKVLAFTGFAALAAACAGRLQTQGSGDLEGEILSLGSKLYEGFSGKMPRMELRAPNTPLLPTQ